MDETSRKRKVRRGRKVKEGPQDSTKNALAVTVRCMKGTCSRSVLIDKTLHKRKVRRRQKVKGNVNKVYRIKLEVFSADTVAFL
jgi:hypothetical protein